MSAEVIEANELVETEVTPEVPTSVVEDKVNISDFSIGDGEAVEIKQAEPAKVVEPVAKTAATEPVTKPTTTEPATATEVKPPIVEARDYSFAAPEHVALFKKMSNEAFNHFKGMYVEHKKLQEDLVRLKTETSPKSTYDNPEAYKLDKQFIEAQETYQRAEEEASFWTKQYENIRQGKDWQDYEQQANGSWMLVKREPSAAAEAQVLRYINTCQGIIREQADKANKLATSYSDQFNNSIRNIRETENKFFPQYKDEKAYAADPSIQAMNKQLNLLGQSANPLTPTVCKLYAHIVALEAKMRKPSAPVEQPKVQPASSVVAGSSVEAPKPKPGTSSAIAKFDDFKAAMADSD